MSIVVATLAVIPILAGPEQGLGLSAINAELDKVARWRPSVSIVDQDELFVRDPSFGARLKECGADVVCLSEVLAPHGLAYAMLLVVNTAVQPAHVAVRALDVRQKKIVSEQVGEAHGELAAVVKTRTAKLFDALGFLEAGRIVVKRDREDAAIEVEPAPLQKIAADQFWAAPGRYRVTATAGDRRVSMDVDVAALEEKLVFLELAAPVAPLVESPWLWAGVGAGVVAIAAGIIVVLHGRGTDVCLGRPTAECP